jgi:hypothetical protein
MNCTPSKCPHRELLEKARKACLSCDHIEPSGHGGMVSYEAAGERIVNRQAAYIDRSPRGQVTNLPSVVEERTAELYRRWCGLDTIDALLMLHVSNGGTCATFGAYLNRVGETIAKLDCTRESYRATAWAKFQSLIKRFKPFLKSKLHSWNDGHGGAIRKERVRLEGELAQGNLFGWPPG